jgi:hypothetical protein
MVEEKVMHSKEEECMTNTLDNRIPRKIIYMYMSLNKLVSCDNDIALIKGRTLYRIHYESIGKKDIKDG